MTQSAQTTISSSRPWALRLFNFRQKKSYHRVLFRKHFLTFSKWNTSQWKKNPKFILNHTRRSILFFFFLNHLFDFFIFVYIKCLIVFLLIYIYIYHIACKNADLDLLLSKLEHKTNQQQQQQMCQSSMEQCFPSIFSSHEI